MKRKTKNIISLTLIMLLICSIALTIMYIKNNNSSSSNNNTNQMMSGQNNMGEPPEKASGGDNNTNSNTQKDNSNNTNDMSEPPEKPSGSDSSSDTSEPPEKPSGSDNNSQPSMPNGNSNMMNNQTTTSKITLTNYIILGVECLLLSMAIIYLIQSKFNKKDIKQTFETSEKLIIYILLNIIMTIVLVFAISYVANNYLLKSDSSNNNQMQNNMNNSSSNVEYSASNEIKESTKVSDKEYESSTKDENALSVSGSVKVTASNITVNKTGDSDGGDNTSFYGTNSAIIAKDGATLTLKNITVETNATGANGVFSYGGSATTNNTSNDGTTVNISNSTIVTKKDNSGGIMTTGGGITNANNLTVTTSGTSSAAIRSDRGGGEVNVDGGTYKTTGNGSPSIYSTANISVKNAKLIATASEGIVIEGKNSVSIENVDLTDTNNKLNGQSTTYKNIFLYQSMSGDASDGVSEFTAKNSNITTNKGDTLYITNTKSKITLTNNTIVNNDSTGNFLRAKSDSWGTSGSNGGEVTLVLNNQKVKGNIVIDSVSTLDMALNSSSSYTGTINAKKEAKSIKLTLDKSSKIKLTGDSYITSLDNEDTTNSNIDFNGYKLYVNGKAIN